jgi:hypothetical protein
LQTLHSQNLSTEGKVQKLMKTQARTQELFALGQSTIA